jgi:streptogramin lyase
MQCFAGMSAGYEMKCAAEGSANTGGATALTSEASGRNVCHMNPKGSFLLPGVCFLICILGLGAVLPVVAQSKYSGIYQGKAGGTAFIVAVTAGGRVFGTDNGSKGLSQALDPAKSTVSAAGKLNARTKSGTVVTGTITGDGKVKGIVKVGNETLTLSGARAFK